MSHLGLSLARSLSKPAKVKVGSVPLPVQRKDVGDSDACRSAERAASVPLAGRPRVFLDISIEAVPAGRLVCELFCDIVPRTAENFRQLCTGEAGIGESGKPLHYRGCPFHGISANRAISGGDITRGDGTGGDSIYGGRFKDEGFNISHAAGFLTMANHGTPDSNDSQFMICTREQPSFDGKHVVFARVIEGMDVVHRIEARGTSNGGTVETFSGTEKLVSFRPTRRVFIRDSGQLGSHSTRVLCIGDSEVVKRRRVVPEAHVLHILKTHRDALPAVTWQGVVATCTKGKAKLAVETLRKRVLSADSMSQTFMDLAREYSDSFSAQSSGDLGVVKQGEVHEELEDVIFSLGPGQLSELFETAKGVNLVMRIV